MAEGQLHICNLSCADAVAAAPHLTASQGGSFCRLFQRLKATVTPSLVWYHHRLCGDLQGPNRYPSSSAIPRFMPASGKSGCDSVSGEFCDKKARELRAAPLEAGPEIGCRASPASYVQAFFCWDVNLCMSWWIACAPCPLLRALTVGSSQVGVGAQSHTHLSEAECGSTTRVRHGYVALSSLDDCAHVCASAMYSASCCTEMDASAETRAGA